MPFSLLALRPPQAWALREDRQEDTCLPKYFSARVDGDSPTGQQLGGRARVRASRDGAHSRGHWCPSLTPVVLDWEGEVSQRQGSEERDHGTAAAPSPTALHTWAPRLPLFSWARARSDYYESE